MSTISALTNSNTALATASGTTAATGAAKTLGVDDFMKLLATQFQQQDPLKPMDDTAFIAQTAQFTSLQQTSTLVQQLTQLSASQNLTAANSYLGRQVTVDDSQGRTSVGVVNAVDSSGSTPQLILNGKSYPLSAVVRVEPAPVSPNQPPATSGS